MKRIYIAVVIIAMAIFFGGFLLGQKWESHRLLPVIKLQEQELDAYHQADARLAERHRQERDAERELMYKRARENVENYCKLP